MLTQLVDELNPGHLPTFSYSFYGAFALNVLDIHLAHHPIDTTNSRKVAPPKTPSLFDCAVDKVLESLSKDPASVACAVDGLPAAIRQRVFGEKWERLPYHVFLHVFLWAREQLNTSLVPRQAEGLLASSVDDWILYNERWLQAERRRDWKERLVRFSTQANLVFPHSVSFSYERMLTRVPLSGLTLLDYNKPPTLHIQPSLRSFIKAFDVLTQGLLDGLDWDHVFVAGGMALAALLSTNIVVDAGKWEASDIDIFIYGLDPSEANDKIEQIYNVWLSNLPRGAGKRVLRNARTITFISKYPTPRLQIVLKLVDTPMTTLMHFDLDPCALGFDGSDVWLLPRAARALENEFDPGAFLAPAVIDSEEAASSFYPRPLPFRGVLTRYINRLKKYADRGFGIRILPSYLDSLSLQAQQLQSQNPGYITQTDTPRNSPICIESIMRHAAAWMAKRIRGNLQGSFKEDDLLGLKKTNKVAVFESFGMFMRYTTLQSQVALGNIRLYDGPTMTDEYDDEQPQGYDDEASGYTWDHRFTFAKLRDAVDKLNLRDRLTLEKNLHAIGVQLSTPEKYDGEWIGDRPDLNFDNPPPPGPVLTNHPDTIRRMVLGNTLSEILWETNGGSMIPVFLPINVAKRCNDLVMTASKEQGIPCFRAPLTPLFVGQHPEHLDHLDNEATVPMFWHCDSVRSWQQMDCRIDESYELLRAFRAANGNLSREEADRKEHLATYLSRRVIRKGVEDEFTEFARWVTNPIKTPS